MTTTTTRNKEQGTKLALSGVEGNNEYSFAKASEYNTKVVSYSFCTTIKML